MKYVCAIKRNPLGLFSTHSSGEFHKQLKEKGLSIVMDTLSFSKEELRNLDGEKISHLVESEWINKLII